MNSGAGTATDTSDRLKAAIAELGGIQSLLVAGELDPRILTDFRDAVNRIRNTAWAAYQYTESKITGNDSRSIISIVAGERIRAAYQPCQAIKDDLETTDVHLQAGQLIQLHAATKSLADKLSDVVRELK
jgi:hypothetical protein